MAGPFLPVVSISRSQNVRLGRGPGSATVNELPMGDLPINVQTGALNILTYANLSDPWVRKDYQHHNALGAIDSVGSLSSTVLSDMYTPAASGGLGPIAATVGTGMTVNITGGVLAGRTFGGKIDVPTSTGLPLAAVSATQARVDTVAIDNTGRVFAITGAFAPAQVFEIDTITQATGTTTSGTFTLTFTYGGQSYTTAAIAWNASAATVATAVLAAAGLSGTLTGTGGILPATVTLTASGVLTGTFSGFSVNNALAVGGTYAYAQTTAGVQGPVAPTIMGGNCQAIATFPVAAGATQPSAPTNVIPAS